MEDATSSAQWAVENKQGVALDRGSVADAGEVLDAQWEKDAALGAMALKAERAFWELESRRVQGAAERVEALLKGYHVKCRQEAVEREAIAARAENFRIEGEVCKALAAREAVAMRGRVERLETLLAAELQWTKEMQERFRGEGATR